MPHLDPPGCILDRRYHSAFHPVASAARRANEFRALSIQSHAASTYPADLLRRVADDQGKVGYIAQHHRAGSNEAIPPTRRAAQNGRIGADRRALTDERPLKLALA